MKNLLATLGAVLLLSSAWAQNTTLITPDAPKPRKDTHGQTVSTAAQQTYAPTEKGKFISLIARLKSKNANSKKVANAKGIDKTRSENKKIKAVTVTNATRPDQTRRSVMAHRSAVKSRTERANRPNPVRRSTSNGRFTQVGRS